MINLRRFLFTLGLCLLLIVGIGVASGYSQEAAPIVAVKPNITVPNNAFPSNVPKPIKVEVALVINNISKITDAAGTFSADIDLR
ncbi:MAG: hypothetical protein ACK5QY_02515 [Pseudanabaena sp.]|jgi:hypothetical protein